MSADQKILERIRKLLALGKSSNEHEAKIAMERAHKLLAEHNLSIGAVEGALDDAGDGALVYGQGGPWARQVAGGIAKLYFCRFFFDTLTPGGRKDSLVFVGRKTNVEVAKMVAHHVLETIRLEAARQSSDEAYRNAFRNGAGVRVRQRCEALVLEAMRGEVKAESGKALVLASTYDREKALADRHIEKMGVKLHTPRSHMSSRSREGMEAGRALGDRVSLRPHIGGGARKAIEGGR